MMGRQEHGQGGFSTSLTWKRWSRRIICFAGSRISFACSGCPLKPRCCPKIPARKVRRSIHDDARDYARMIGQTKAYEQSVRDRKKVEITFAHMKRIIGLQRFRLRGMTGARDELLLAATAVNLRKLAKTIWRPPMIGELCPA
jgi:hypothetical protein